MDLLVYDDDDNYVLVGRLIDTVGSADPATLSIINVNISPLPIMRLFGLNIFVPLVNVLKAQYCVPLADTVPAECQLMTDEECYKVDEYRKANKVYPTPLEVVEK